MSHAQALQKLR